MQHLDQNTIEAIQEFKDLVGVSPERIATEFMSGLQKAASPTNYLKNYEVTGLLPAVFPGAQGQSADVERIGNNKNIKAVLAWVLRDSEPRTVRLQLNRCKYPNEVSDGVAFLLRLFRFDVYKSLNC